MIADYRGRSSLLLRRRYGSAGPQQSSANRRPTAQLEKIAAIQLIVVSGTILGHWDSPLWIQADCFKGNVSEKGLRCDMFTSTAEERGKK
jgi:hypothetical protein